MSVGEILDRVLSVLREEHGQDNPSDKEIAGFSLSTHTLALSPYNSHTRLDFIIRASLALDVKEQPSEEQLSNLIQVCV